MYFKLLLNYKKIVIQDPKKNTHQETITINFPPQSIDENACESFF